MKEREPGVWRLRVYTGRDPRTHNPRQHHETFRGTEAAAKKRLARLVTEAEDGKFSVENATFGDLLDRWLKQIERQRSLRTMQDYRGCIEHAIRPALGSVKLRKLGGDTLDGWYRHWEAEVIKPATKTRPAVTRSTTTVRKYHAIISAACAQAVKWEWLTSNPAARASPPSPNAPIATAPSPDELLRMVSAAEETDPALATAIALAALTGMRRGELCALRWSDVTPEKIVVSRSLTVIKRKVTEGPTKTHQVRVIALDEIAVEVLEERKRYVDGVAATAAAELDPAGFVLSPRADGKRPMLPDTLGHRFLALVAGLGMNYHLHQLRHFTATQLLAAGVDPRTVSGRLGHATTSTTLRIYAHAVEGRDQAAAGIIGDTLRPKQPRSQAISAPDSA